VLEGVACFCWLLALDSGKQPHERDRETNPMNAAGETNPISATGEATPCKSAAAAYEPDGIAIRDSLTADADHGGEPVAPAVAEAVADDRERVAAEIAAGRVRCTVADIRRYLGCSQTRALELRRELAVGGGLP
jgi:hypothetical protein